MTGFFYLLFEAKNVQITRTIIKLDKIKKGESIKIIHLSDIHIDILKQNTTITKNILAKENPDIILLSGDYINTAKKTNSFLSWILTVQPKDVPIYACLGNHDIHAFSSVSRDEENTCELPDLCTIDNLSFIDKKAFNSYVEDLNSYGINILDNANTIVEIKKNKINLVGIGEFRYHLSDYKKSYADLDLSKPTVVLGHNPDMVLELPYEKTDLFLCGHFHGGQIRLPFNLEYKVFRNEKLCGEGYTRGLHTINNIKTYINRGIGCVLLPFRFLSRPEIAVIELVG